MLFVLFVALTLGSPTVSTSSDTIVLANPLHIEALGRLTIPDAVFAVLYFGTWAVSVASVFIRFRRAGGVERQQIKWVAFGLLAAFVAILLSDSVDDATLSAVVGAAGFLAFPISIGIAVLKFHLYDLDVVVKRAVVYAALAVFATLVYLTVVVGVGAWLGRDSSILTMLAAVIVAVTFQPVRARFDEFADRLVYGTQGHAVRGARRLRGTGRRGLPRRRPAAPHGARARGGGRGRAGRRLAEGRRRASRRARRGPPTRRSARRRAARRPGRALRSRAPTASYRVEHAGELLGALAVSQAAERPDLARRRQAGRGPRRAGRARAPQRRGSPRSSGRASRSSGRRRSGSWPRRTRSVAGSSATSTTAPSSSSWRSP